MNRFTPGDSFNCITNLQGQPCANRKEMVQEADVNGNQITPRLTGTPNFDRIFFPLADVNSDFNAMLLHVSKVYAHGFSIDGTYRWSKSIDTSSFGRGPQQADPSQQSLDRGPSDFDVRHQFVLYGLWDLPFFKLSKGYLGKALGGWRSEEHTSELQSLAYLVCRLLLEKKKNNIDRTVISLAKF